MTGLAPVAHDSGTLRGRRAIAGGRRALDMFCTKPHWLPLLTIQPSSLWLNASKRMESRTKWLLSPSRGGWLPSQMLSSKSANHGGQFWPR